jgi:hypothetical protein
MSATYSDTRRKSASAQVFNPRGDNFTTLTGLPRGTGSPDFAVSRDGKSVLVSREFGPFIRVSSVPAQGHFLEDSLE